MIHTKTQGCKCFQSGDVLHRSGKLDGKATQLRPSRHPKKTKPTQPVLRGQRITTCFENCRDGSFEGAKNSPFFPIVIVFLRIPLHAGVSRALLPSGRRIVETTQGQGQPATQLLYSHFYPKDHQNKHLSTPSIQSMHHRIAIPRPSP
jgi:hypothetical protein